MKHLIAVLVLISISVLSGCKTMSGIMVSGQSSHPGNSEHKPPAHGQRAKTELHEYYYYPNSYVYFDLSRNVYFYLSGSRWLVSASLPKHYKLDQHRVSLKMTSDKPYSHYTSHKKKYPKKHKRKSRKHHKNYDNDSDH